jgi:hypothetical protein
VVLNARREPSHVNDLHRLAPRGLASGATFLHDSKVADKWGDSVTDHDNGIMWWRAAKNLEAALAAGMDPLQAPR